MGFRNGLAVDDLEGDESRDEDGEEDLTESGFHDGVVLYGM